MLHTHADLGESNGVHDIYIAIRSVPNCACMQKQIFKEEVALDRATRFASLAERFWCDKRSSMHRA